MLEHKIKLLTIFSALFCQPEKDVFNNLDIINELSHNLLALTPEPKLYLENLLVILPELDYEKLLVEYTTIFLGPFGAIAHPYSSVYFGENTLMNDITIWVLKFYNETGLKYDEELHDMPDNLIVELEFLHFLNYSIYQAIEEGDTEKLDFFKSRENQFFNNHFAIWLPKMSEKIINSNASEYYINLCKCLDSFVKNYFNK